MYLCGFRLRKLFRGKWLWALIMGALAIYVTNKLEDLAKKYIETTKEKKKPRRKRKSRKRIKQKNR